MGRLKLALLNRCCRLLGGRAAGAVVGATGLELAILRRYRSVELSIGARGLVRLRIGVGEFLVSWVWMVGARSSLWVLLGLSRSQWTVHEALSPELKGRLNLKGIEINALNSGEIKLTSNKNRHL